MSAPKGSQKLAVLLCKFQDTARREPQPRSFFEDLFVKVGTGGLNDYWRAASKGAINLDGTRVFGWNTLPEKRADYLRAHPDRWGKILGAFPAFPGFKPEDFAGVVAVFNSDVEDGGFHNGVMVNFDGYNVTFLAHETGHLFGLEHSFDESPRKNAVWSAPGEYFDPYDIMSAMAVAATPSPRFGTTGPLACAPHLDRMQWLDPKRIWSPATKGSDAQFIDLVSLGHPEVPGYLAARINNLYVEFRTRDGFDSGIQQPTVLIHRLSGPHPIVIASNKSTWDFHWLPGMQFGSSDAEIKANGGLQIRIESFDLSAKKARLRIRYIVRLPEINAETWVTVHTSSDGSALQVNLFAPGVRVVPGPGPGEPFPIRHSPIQDVLIALTVHEIATRIGSRGARRELQQSALGFAAEELTGMLRAKKK